MYYRIVDLHLMQTSCNRHRMHLSNIVVHSVKKVDLHGDKFFVRGWQFIPYEGQGPQEREDVSFPNQASDR